MMLSVEPLSVRAHGTSPLEPIGGYPGTIVPFYLSDRRYATKGTDSSLPHRQFLPRVNVPLQWERTVPIAPEGGQRQAVSYGETVLANGDGHFDTMVERYAIDGRRVVVRVGTRDFAYADFETLFDGTAAGWRLAEDDTVRVALRDNGFRLEVPLQQNLYKGTGGLEGTVELVGKPKPLAFGDLRTANVPGVLVDPVKLIYQWHDGALSEFTRVYDRGLELTHAGDIADLLAADPPASGTFVSQRSIGCIRLGSTPAGLVTADLVGDNAGGVALSAPDIALRILTARALLGPADIDGASFSDLEIMQPANVGYWFAPEPLLVSQALDRVFAGINAWWGCSRLGGIQCGRVDAPAAAVDASFDAVNILSLERLEPPESLSPPNWRRRVGYQPNYAVQTTDLAGAVTAERRQFLAQAFRVTAASREQVKSDYLRATDPDPLGNAFAFREDAEAEVRRLLDLWAARRALYRLTTKLKAYRLGIGRTVRVTDPRYGLAAGANAVIVGTRIDTERNESGLLLVV